MRLVCPNCEAKYEVPEDAIPETGRDVQCANCGHAWYQMRPRAAGAEPGAVAPAAAPAVVPPPASVAEPQPEPAAIAPEPKAPSADVPVVAEPEPERAVEPEHSAQSVEPVAAPETPAAVAPAAVPVVEAVSEVPVAPAPGSEPSVETVAAGAERQPDPAAVTPEAPATGEGVADPEDDAALPGAAAAAPVAYAVDDSVLAILREEAEREAEARRAEAARPLEVQQDLGIDAAIPAAAPAVAAGAAAAAAAVDEATDRVAGRRTRLPDVEEINSTLRPSEPPAEETVETAAPIEVEGRSSFRSGFLLVLTIAILASALYISADALARAVPALAGVLESYVSLIDGLRLWMDGLMQSATVAINGSGG
ncbi:zinc-ribbon domain-containing protein [Tabrizicola flagellatus]|uniref:zinc-ribbon domain-containing protein n=1 Tax=Tabrizicola flagellatus TaxID=2593021 RepID=UPI00190F1A9E|nr:zinc-ribbon domain-containing protein [Tabrizicola flagellatus]